MLRIAIILVLLVFAALVGTTMANQPGQVMIEWFGTRIETTAFFGAAVMVLLLALLLPVVNFLILLLDAPGRIGKAAERARRKKGQESLALGLIAAEAGEFEEARKHAGRAENLIEEPRLANLLEARAAEVAGDVAGAERSYSAMLANEDTELLGRKGLLASALKRGDRQAAMSHAEAALKLSKTSTWPFTTLFDLKVQSGEWDGAIAALDEGEKRKLVEPRIAARRKAVLLTAAAAREDRDGRLDRAIDNVEKAVRLSPGFAPAAALASRLMVEDGKVWKAASILEEAWQNEPHPAIAHAYRDIKSDETAAERAKRMATLVDLNPITAKAKSSRRNSRSTARIGIRAGPRLKKRFGKIRRRASRRCSPLFVAARATKSARAIGWCRRLSRRANPIGRISIRKARRFCTTTMTGRGWFTSMATPAS